MTVGGHRYALLTVVVGGLAVRVWTIGERSFWFDEAFSYTLACESTWSEMLQRTAGDVHPPLSYAAICLWSYLAGTSVVGLRMFSVFGAALTMVGCYLFCKDALAGSGERGGHPDPLLSPHPAPLPRGEERNREDGGWRMEDGPHPGPLPESEGRIVGGGADEARWIGVSAAALIGACSLHIKWSQETRMYTLGTALVFFSTWTLIRALRARENSSWWWCGYVVCAAALAYTHNFGLFSIVGQAVYCIGVLMQGFAHDFRGASPAIRDTDEPHPSVDSCQLSVQRTLPSSAEGVYRAFAGGFRRGRARYAMIAFLAIVVAYLPWLGSLLSQTQRAEREYWTPSINGRTVMNCFGGLVVPTNSYGVDSSTAVAVTAAFAVVLGLLACKGGAAWLLIAMIVAPVCCALAVSLASVPVFIDRYFLFAYMFVLCAVPYLAAHWIAAPYRTWLIGLLIANSLAGHWVYWTSLDTANRPGIGGAAGYVAEYRKVGEQVIVTHPTIYFSARYYLRGIAAPLLFVPKGTKPHYMGGPAIAPEWTIDEEGLRNLDRVWLLDVPYAPDGSGRPSFPKEWKPVPKTTATFPEAFWFLADVTAAEYEQERAANEGGGE